MRLLNVHTLDFQEFIEQNIPNYCILSHRWGEKEVSYKDYRKGRNLDGPGYRKIVDFCRFVKDRRAEVVRREMQPFEAVEWVWVDTCCIDKRSSAELSEAINSMFAWYNRARECYVYLADVSAGRETPEAWEAFRHSAWFQRGWTLQELLASRLLVFCNASWEVLGYIEAADTRLAGVKGGRKKMSDLLDEVSGITGIRAHYIKRPWNLVTASVAEKMSWAARRQTTRIEDEAYCLLGLFEINMPLIYGEGRSAFQRLQEEIIKRSTDQSVLA